ncbi:hypothetical protein AURDEDRAFT_166219 [Auricularia subglabra TFB-10046 SS5]|nr:hypothetical protein AURDEDRAFT_166219 [Auricularia subglabra TFB-10046 SS5]
MGFWSEGFAGLLNMMPNLWIAHQLPPTLTALDGASFSSKSFERVVLGPSHRTVLPMLFSGRWTARALLLSVIPPTWEFLEQLDPPPAAGTLSSTRELWLMIGGGLSRDGGIQAAPLLPVLAACHLRRLSLHAKADDLLTLLPAVIAECRGLHALEIRVFASTPPQIMSLVAVLFAALPGTLHSLRFSAATTQAHLLEDLQLSEDARFWKVFRTEATSYDRNDDAHQRDETLGDLLVFAALFLGVITAFVIQAYPSFVGKDSEREPSPLADSKGEKSNPPLVMWVMLGLWLVSLILSLVVSFFCILVKQWLQDYTMRLAAETPNARQWALRRASYLRALQLWRIDTIVPQVLPLLLHIALFLFAIGLNIFLSALKSPISWIICAITATAGTVYVACSLASIHWGTARISTIAQRIDNGHVERHEMEGSAIEWLLSLSHSGDALFTAFCAVSALPESSNTLRRVRERGLGLADVFYSTHFAPLMPIDVMRVIRSELHLRPGDWRIPNLGLDMPKEFAGVLQQTQSADGGILFAATLEVDERPRYIAVHAGRWRDLGSTSLSSTIGLLLRCSNIDARAILYLMLPLNSGDICKLYPDITNALNRKWKYWLARHAALPLCNIAAGADIHQDDLHK